MATVLCESCGMPIQDGPYCHYCVDEKGKLQPFEVRFQEMVEWTLKRADIHDRAEAERRTFAYLSSMPAWENNPKVKQAG